MSLAVTLTPETEEWVREESARSGVAPEAFAAQTLEEQRLVARIRRLSHRPPPLQARYDYLVRRMLDHHITPEERAELRKFTDEAEQRGADRLESLIALSHLRGLTVPQLMAELGISAPEPV